MRRRFDKKMNWGYNLGMGITGFERENFNPYLFLGVGFLFLRPPVIPKSKWRRFYLWI